MLRVGVVLVDRLAVAQRAVEVVVQVLDLLVAGEQHQPARPLGDGVPVLLVLRHQTRRYVGRHVHLGYRGHGSSCVVRHHDRLPAGSLQAPGMPAAAPTCTLNVMPSSLRPAPFGGPPVGGQAVIEGVMIRGQRHMAVAARTADGAIELRDAPVATAAPSPLRRVPFVRGLVILLESLSLGMRALGWSTRVQQGDANAALPPSRPPFAPLLALGFIIFCVPVLLTFWLGWLTSSEFSEVIAEGIVRLLLVIGYIAALGAVPEFQRLFAYHGAEHRAIHAWEHARPLTVDAIRTFPNAHARCGTAFLLTIVVLSGLVFLLFGAPPLWLRLIERIVLAPLIAAIAYETIRLGQRFGEAPVVRLLFLPNLWMQRLTTRDPDDAQIEVAIAALERALTLEAAAGDEPARAAEPLS